MTIVSEALVATQYATATNQNLVCEFRRAQFRGFVGKIWATVTGRSNSLMDVETSTKGKPICSCGYIGSKTVRIQQIKGSEGRCQDFDLNFNPLKNHNQNRWISIASAWQRGVHLPAVDLIKIGDKYVVRDGHHRISVAKFMGCIFIDANVTEWVLAN